MDYAKVHIDTEDVNFSDELNDLDIPGVKVLMRLTAAVTTHEVLEYIINFSSQLAVTAFGVWLAERVKKKRPRDSQINGEQIPNDVSEIILIIRRQQDDGGQEE